MDGFMAAKVGGEMVWMACSIYGAVLAKWTEGVEGILTC